MDFKPLNPGTFGDLLAVLKGRRPLVHHITNYVTVNDCANITLCIGAAPVMAEAPEEACEMVAMADALVLNIGTLTKPQVSVMQEAGSRANERGIPVILDPVGAGATRMRTDAARTLLDRLDVAVLKGNAGEIGVLAGAGGRVRGVDSDGSGGDALAIARAFADDSGIIVVVSGATDIVTDGGRVLQVDNGHEMMGRLSGTGCMAASLAGAFAAVSDDYVISSAAALAAFGLAGEAAATRAAGPYSFRTALFDELAAMSPEYLGTGARVRSAQKI
ncbi:MAG: hydroxyethylthiazole kinase [Methanoregula sp.]|nr:MAG: hydroxyethylthiazole kinase [Methanoregula sp.]